MVARLDPFGQEQSRDTVRSTVKLAVSHLLLFEAKRHMVRRTLGLLGEQLMQRFRFGIISLRTIECDNRFVDLRGKQTVGDLNRILLIGKPLENPYIHIKGRTNFIVMKEIGRIFKLDMQLMQRSGHFQVE
ncbi:hypothetical protein D3C72_1877650 [compost metagenome]